MGEDEITPVDVIARRLLTSRKRATMPSGAR
jgi:hypothetical protein